MCFFFVSLSSCSPVCVNENVCGYAWRYPKLFFCKFQSLPLLLRLVYPKMYTPPDITPNSTKNMMWLSIPPCPSAHKPFTVRQVRQSLKISGYGWWSLFYEGSRWLLVSKKSAAYCGSRTAVTSGILLPQSRKWRPCCLLPFTPEEVHSSTSGRDDVLTQQDSNALRGSHSSTTDTYPKTTTSST